jgi:hypothetical protein
VRIEEEFEEVSPPKFNVYGHLNTDIDEYLKYANNFQNQVFFTDIGHIVKINNDMIYYHISFSYHFVSAIVC